MNQEPPFLRGVEQSYRRVGSPGRVLVAFSGGADSTALLHALVALSIQLSFELACVHVNHGLRKSADAEEKLAAAQALSLKIPFLTKKVSISKKGNLEANAREARYQAFGRVLAETGFDAVALAQHAGDQAETLLMHLMRGAGLDGLSGMPEWRAPYWRPLLRVGKEELRAYLQNCGIDWVEDESNLDQGFTRNRIRNCLLPLMDEMAPGVVSRVAAASELLYAEKEAADAVAARWLCRNAKREPPFYYLMRDSLLAQPLAVQRRALRTLAAGAGVPLDFAWTEALRELLPSEEASFLSLPEGFKAYFSRKRLHILPEAVESTHVAFLSPTMTDTEPAPEGGRKWQVLDTDRLAGASMRQVRPGDRIELLGKQGSQPLRKYLSARRVDEPLRTFWPVYAREDGLVLWVPGYGPGKTAAVTEHTTRASKIEFIGLLPDEILEEGENEPGMQFV